MKVLFLTPQLPYPPTSGGAIKSHKLLSFLTENHQVGVACLLKSEADEQNLSVFKAILPQVPVYSLPLSLARTPLNFALSCLAGVPLTIYRNRAKTFQQYVDSVANDYDVIFVDHYLVAQYVPKHFSGRVVVHQHNAEFLIWSRMAEQTTNWLKKSILHFESRRIKNYEVAMCARADAVLAAPNDQQALLEAGAVGDRFFDTYHLGDEENLDCPALEFEQTSLSVLFIGTLTWEANVDGLIWFLQDIWPQVLALLPEATFTIAGKHSDALRQKILQLAPMVNLLGFVDDLEDLYSTHRVFVAPLRFGSGIKVKVVNGLYRGIPTVTTPVGAEGLKLVDGEHLAVVQNAQAFAERVLSLLQDKLLWQKLSEQSRVMMKQHYTWAVVFEQVKKSLGDL